MLLQQQQTQLQPLQHVHHAPLCSPVALQGARRLRQPALRAPSSSALSLYSSVSCSSTTAEHPSTSGRASQEATLRPSGTTATPSLHFHASARRHNKHHQLLLSSHTSSSTPVPVPAAASAPPSAALSRVSSAPSAEKERRERLRALVPHLAVPACLSVLALLLAPSQAQASGGAMSGQMLDTFKQFLVRIRLGGRACV